MITMNFQQALQGMHSEWLALAPKLPLPRAEALRREQGERHDTPYLRRRMRSKH